jgi:metal-responsive CopG/Arc/MetJ family transcriptional regulator
MPRQPYAKISITLPSALLAQIDSLARRHYDGRSAVIRSAVRAYVMREAPGLLRPAGHRQPSKAMIKRMRKEFPAVAPDDIELLQLLTYYKYERKD